MYTGLVCLVLFDARGKEEGSIEAYGPAAAVLALAVLIAQYMPSQPRRPRLVDKFCEDLLHIAAHMAAAYMIRAHVLNYYACALHSTCFLLQTRLKPSVFVHTITAMWLAAAFFYGPRISDLQIFITAVAFPHVVDIVACAVTHLHQLGVLWLMEMS